jgi:hypothetical protein
VKLSYELSKMMKQALEDHHRHYISDTVRSNKLNAIEDQKTDFI